MKYALLRYCTIAVLITFFIIPAFAAEKMQVAVIDLKPKGTSRIISNAVSDILRSEMVKTGFFTVIERAQMDEVLREQGFQQTGCTDASCAVQVGKLLSAKKILLGEVNRVGRAYMITVRIVDVEKGLAEFAANEKAVSEDVLDVAGRNITQKLARNIYSGNKNYFVERKTRTGYYTRSLLPGLGHLYAGETVKGYSFMGSFAAGLGLMAYGYFNYSSATSAYEDVPRGSPQADFDAKYDDKVKAANLFYIFSGITALVYTFSWADALFLTKPSFDGSDNAAAEYRPEPVIATLPGPGANGERVYTCGMRIRF